MNCEIMIALHPGVDMHIETLFSQARTIADLETILIDARSAQTSIWGARYLSFTQYEGTLEIPSFMYRLFELRASNIYFNEAERKSGRYVIKKIFDFDRATFEMMKQSCLLTRIFNIIREEFFIGHYNLPEWEEDYSDVFSYYNFNQFVNAFGCTPIEAIYDVGKYTDFLHSAEPISDEFDFERTKVWAVHPDYKGPSPHLVRGRQKYSGKPGRIIYGSESL